MLAEITIQNFAIIDHLSIEFGAGMTVLSGETGAGKSILVDALNLILGERADAGVVREGQERADISARFSLADVPGAREWLCEHELDSGDECVIRRIVASNGRSRGWINGTPMPVRELRSLGMHLVDIHGQHAHQRLLSQQTQRLLVDEFGQHDQQLQELTQAVRRWQDTQAEINRIEQRNSQGQSRLELLRYQVEELQTLGLESGELESLEAEHKKLASSEYLTENSQRALNLLYDLEEGAAAEHLGTAKRLLEELGEIDPEFATLAEQINNALIQTQEASDSLRRYIDSLDIDPQRFAEVENRLSTIRDVARKHQVAPAELLQLAEQLQAELTYLEGADAKLEQLKTQARSEHEAYLAAAERLSQVRQDTAPLLARQVTQTIRNLGMPEGQFDVCVFPQAYQHVSEHGTDQIEFVIAANPGQSFKPLARVASGGELSRISLAIEVIAAARTRVPTLVFDEVDTGIGGGVAEIVGRQLRALGDKGQSLCVTHLPQVAAQAQHHLYIAKQVHDGQTRTRITALEHQARIEELARMLGGIELTEQTRAHAADMINRATNAPSA